MFVAAFSGCAPPGNADLELKVTRLEERLDDRNNELAAQRSTIQQLNKQLTTARALTDEDLKKVYYPEKLVIGPLTGGEDYDGTAGDDGVTVFLRPVDRDGDVLKVVGDIRIELFDLQAPDGRRLLGSYYVPADRVHENWYGKFLTYHYTIRCPWKTGPPAHDEITIRATFVDYLTQRVMTAQVVRTVALSG